MLQRQQISTKTGIALLMYLLSVSVLELLAYRYEGIFSVLAAWLWLLTGGLCFTAFLLSAFLTAKQDMQNKKYFLLIGYTVLLTLFCSVIGNLSFSDISYEAALQTAAGLSSFGEPDFNYTGVAFLNYANRQYVINALPSFLFGRSIVTLHLGYALPFLIGMTLWFLELRCQLRIRDIREEYALLPVYALVTFPYVTEYFMNFEQTLTPISYTMMCLALLLRFYRKRDIIGVLSLSFLGGMCCNAYTPVLAFFGFLLFFLALWGIRTLWQNRTALCSTEKSALPASGTGGSIVWELLVCFGLFVQLISYFAATLVTPQKSMISTVKQEISLFEVMITSWFDFFSDTQGTFWGIWLGVILLYLFFACLLQLTFYDFLAAGWMLLTVFFSSYMTGYTSYAKYHEIQRNMLIIPIFLTALFFLLIRCLTALKQSSTLRNPRAKFKKFLFPLTLLFFLLLGMFHFTQPHRSFLYYGYVQPIKYLFDYTEETLQKKGIADTDEFNLIFLTDNRLQSNLSDYCAYFYPNAHTFVTETSSFPDNLDNTLPTLIFSESEEPPCDRLLTMGSSTRNSLRYRRNIILYYMENN